MDGGAGFSGLTPAIERFFYLKLVTSYATTSSMVLIVYDFGESGPRDEHEFFIFARQFTHGIPTVTTLGQEVSALTPCPQVPQPLTQQIPIVLAVIYNVT